MNRPQSQVANRKDHFVNIFSYEILQGSPSAPVDQSLNNGHLRLFELLLCITSGGVGEEDGVADLDVVLQRNVLYFHSENCK